MRFSPTIFGQLLEPINRRQFTAIVERHDADAYDKTFRCWDHLIALIYAQMSGHDSLRALEAGWNACRQHHYHLGATSLSRSTLADANKRRPAAVFADTFNLLTARIDRQTRRDGKDLVRLIDSTPIPLGCLCQWAKSNGRIRGMKAHIVYDPGADLPRLIDTTHANVNDAQIGRSIAIERGATYVFDKGYCHYGWWKAIAETGSVFVTRPKTNMGLRVVEKRQLAETVGDGYVVLQDEEVAFASKGDSKLPIRLRRITLQRDNGNALALITNDLKRSAVEVAALYKGRWQIELFFRWIKQHLKIRKFLGLGENAIRLQILAALIAYALLRIAAKVQQAAIPILRFTDIVRQTLFERRQIEAINVPPPTNPSKRKDKSCREQLSLHYS